MTRLIFRHLKLGFIALLCFAMLVFFLLNQHSGFYRGEIEALYSDGHYIAQVAKNLAAGKGYSYWDGFSYSYWDYEISTGPTIVFPMTAAILLGFNIEDVFFYIPLAVNIFLFAILLIVWCRRLDEFHFLLMSFSAAIFFVSYQRWLWYLPIGDVASVLLFLISLSLIPSSGKSVWLFAGSGVFFSLAMLSKLMVFLAFPFLVLYFSAYSWRNFLVWAASFFLPVIMFVVSLFYLKSTNNSLEEFYEAFLSFINRSFIWAFPEFHVLEMASASGWLNKLLWNWKIYNNVWWDNVNQYHLFALLAISLFILFAAFKNISRINTRMLQLVLSLLAIFFAWGFLIGVKGGRYALMFVGLMSLSAPLLAGFLGRFYLLTCVTLMCFVNGCYLFYRGIVLERMIDDPVTSAYGAAEEIRKIISNNDIKEVVITDNVYRPYLNIALYIDEPDIFVSSFSLVDKEAFYSEKTDCLSLPVTLSIDLASTGQVKSPSFRCYSAGIKLNYRWVNDFDWKYVLDAGYQKKVPACSQLELESNYYRLYRCSKKEIERLVYSESAGLLNFE